MQMAEQRGIPFDPERIKGLLEKIVFRINDTDEIVKNLNHFSHTVESKIQVFDLGKLLKLMYQIASRQVKMRRIELEILPNKEQVQMASSPFLMLQLLALVTETAVENIQECGKLTIKVNAEGHDVCYVFLGMKGPLLEYLETNDDFHDLKTRLDAHIEEVINPAQTTLSFMKILKSPAWKEV
jgi:hypothetical protein